jgi:hypothetical protein
MVLCYVLSHISINFFLSASGTQRPGFNAGQCMWDLWRE